MPINSGVVAVALVNVLTCLRDSIRRKTDHPYIPLITPDERADGRSTQVMCRLASSTDALKDRVNNALWRDCRVPAKAHFPDWL